MQVIKTLKMHGCLVEFLVGGKFRIKARNKQLADAVFNYLKTEGFINVH